MQLKRITKGSRTQYLDSFFNFLQKIAILAPFELQFARFDSHLKELKLESHLKELNYLQLTLKTHYNASFRD